MFSTVLIASENKQNPDALEGKIRTSTVCSELENSHMSEWASFTNVQQICCYTG